MNIFPLLIEHQSVPGFSEFTFAPIYSPTVAIYDSGVEKAAEAVIRKCRKGVFILVETQPDGKGKHKIYVGSAGVERRGDTPEGKQDTFMDRIKYLESTQPKEAQLWDKAIFLCDWEKDIFWAATGTAPAQKLGFNAFMSKMKKEVRTVEKLLYRELKKINQSGSLAVKQPNKNPPDNIPPSDLNRYEHYIEIVMLCLQKIIPNYNEPPLRSHTKHFIKEKWLEVGEKIYGRFDSQAVILDAAGNVRVTEFLKDGKAAGKRDISSLNRLSLRKAASEIFKANGVSGNVNSPKFWKVIRDNNFYEIENLRE